MIWITDFVKLTRTDLLNAYLDQKSVVFKLEDGTGLQCFFSGKKYSDKLH